VICLRRRSVRAGRRGRAFRWDSIGCRTTKRFDSRHSYLADDQNGRKTRIRLEILEEKGDYILVSERILVTGGAGYVGSVVVSSLLERGHRVRVLDALAHGSIPSLLLAWGRDQFEFIRGDVRDPAVRSRALEDVGAVVHLAAIVGDPACARQPDLARNVNVDATIALAADAEAAGVGRLLFASTCSNYGKMNGTDFIDEEGELAPVSLYAETKVAAEHEVLARGGGSMATCCLRFATVFGASPRMRFDLTVNEFARDVRVQGHLLVYGEQFWRPYIHVRDVARAVVLALEADVAAIRGQVFNVGDTQENYRKLDIVELLEQRFPGARFEFVHKEEDPRDYRVSFEKFERELGFNAERSVAEGIDEVVTLLDSGLIDDPYAPVYSN
jgi:nucleoside-diphosphate-sugar epimerase